MALKCYKINREINKTRVWTTHGGPGPCLLAIYTISKYKCSKLTIEHHFWVSGITFVHQSPRGLPRPSTRVSTTTLDHDPVPQSGPQSHVIAMPMVQNSEDGLISAKVLGKRPLKKSPNFSVKMRFMTKS